MKNITGFSVLVIILWCGQPLTALETLSDKYAFSVIPQFGFLYGQAEEIVYPEDTKAPMLSQLLWDMKPVFYAGLLLDFSQVKPVEGQGFFADLSMKYGFPGNSGIMENRDWQSIENDSLTSFSSHNNVSKEIFLLDFSAGYSMPVKGIAVLKAFINLSFSRFSFFGTDGYGKYARGGSGNYYSIDDAPREEEFSGKIINYTQEWFNAAPGFAAGIYFLRYFYAGLSFQISPLILCVDLDEHLTRELQFRDYMLGGMFMEPQLVVSFSIREWFEISIEAAWRRICGSRGNTYQRPLPTIDYEAVNYYPAGEAGAGLSVMDAGLRLKIRL